MSCAMIESKLTTGAQPHRLINAVGRDYGSAPPVEDQDDADEVLADSEGIAFSPKMLLERERELLASNSPSQPLSPQHKAKGTSVDMSYTPKSGENGDIDPLASSIHAIYRPWQQQHSPMTHRKPADLPEQPSASRLPTTSASAVIETDQRDHVRREEAAEDDGEDEADQESDSDENDDTFDSQASLRRHSPLTASRLRELDKALEHQASAASHVSSSPEQEQELVPTEGEPDDTPDTPPKTSAAVMSRAQRLSDLAEKLQEVFGHAEKEEVVAGALGCSRQFRSCLC